MYRAVRSIGAGRATHQSRPGRGGVVDTMRRPPSCVYGCFRCSTRAARKRSSHSRSTAAWRARIKESAGAAADWRSTVAAAGRDARASRSAAAAPAGVIAGCSTISASKVRAGSAAATFAARRDGSIASPCCSTRSPAMLYRLPCCSAKSVRSSQCIPSDPACGHSFVVSVLSTAS